MELFNNEGMKPRCDSEVPGILLNVPYEMTTRYSLK